MRLLYEDTILNLYKEINSPLPSFLGRVEFNPKWLGKDFEVDSSCIETFPCYHLVHFDYKNEHSLNLYRTMNGRDIYKLFEDSNEPIPEHFAGYKKMDWERFLS